MTSAGADAFAEVCLIPECEGPTLLQRGGLAVVSMSEGQLYEINDQGAQVLAVPHGGPNGLTEGPDARLYVAQMGSTRPIAKSHPEIPGGVQAISPDGIVSWVTMDPISPNDLCFGPDGLLYVTDPTRQRPWIDGRLWRCDVETGEAELLRTVDWYTNGIGFGLEDDCIYVAAMSERSIVRFPLDGGPHRIGKAETFVELPYGAPDGFAFDVDGNLVVCAIQFDDSPGELQVYDREGVLLERLRPGPHSRYTNLAIDADGSAFVTCGDGGQVLVLSHWGHRASRSIPFAGLDG